MIPLIMPDCTVATTSNYEGEKGSQHRLLAQQGNNTQDQNDKLSTKRSQKVFFL
jgi:hypothetical protein